MQDFLSLWSGFLTSICDFLLTEPVIWFTGCFVLIAVVAVVNKIIRV